VRRIAIVLGVMTTMLVIAALALVIACIWTTGELADRLGSTGAVPVSRRVAHRLRRRSDVGPRADRKRGADMTWWVPPNDLHASPWENVDAPPSTLSPWASCHLPTLVSTAAPGRRTSGTSAIRSSRRSEL
jgi:hypothetical protein